MTSIASPGITAAPNAAASKPTRDPHESLNNLRLAVIAIILVAAGVFALTSLGAGSDTQQATDQQAASLAVVASDIVTAAKTDGQARDAIGGYLPGTGIVLTVQLPELGSQTVHTWARDHLDPYAEALAILPEGESVIVTVTEANQAQARVWRLTPEAISGNEGTWNQLVAPATFVEAGTVAVVDADRAPASAPASAPANAPVTAPAASTGRVGAAPDASGASVWADNWKPIFGSWVLSDGLYSQTDATGFGFASAYIPATPDEFDVAVEVRAQYGELGGGIIFGLPDPSTKANGHVVDITDDGGYLRWGTYDENGEWSFVGGAPIEPKLAQLEWNKLEVQVRPGHTGVLLNDVFIARIDAVEPNRHVALVSSISALDFRTFTLEPADTDHGHDHGAPSSDASTLSSWSLLSGSWKADDGVLSQTNGDAFDQMAHFGEVARGDYRAEVQLRPLPDSEFSAGILFNVTTLGERASSHVFDIVNDGAVVRWACYDENGVYDYRGGVALPDSFDPDEWHTIAVEVRDGRAEFFVNGTTVGAWDDAGDIGHAGLVTSKAAMEFRDFAVTPLD